METNSTLSVTDKVHFLVLEEERFKPVVKDEEESANAAYRMRSQQHRLQPRGGESHRPAYSNNIECFFCEENHRADECPYKEDVREMVKGLKDKKNNRKHHDRQDKKYSGGDKTHGGRSRSDRKKALAAALESSSSSDSRCSSSSSSSGNGDEKARIARFESDHSDDSFDHAVRALISKHSHSRSRYRPSEVPLDTGCSRTMTDLPSLFRRLITIPKVTIQVRGGKLFSEQMGTMKVEAKDGTYFWMEDCLLVPDLGITLVSAKQLCKQGLTGAFNHTKLQMSIKDHIVIVAQQRRGLYAIDHIAPWLQGRTLNERSLQGIGFRVKSAFPRPLQPAKALPASVEDDGAIAEEEVITDSAEVLIQHNHVDPADEIEDFDESDDERPTTKADRVRYRLLHRRFGHYNPKLLRKLHLVTTLQEPIRVPEKKKRICAACKIGKMRKRISHKLAPHKKELLELVSIDIAGPFPISLRKNRYLLQIIDSYSRKVWSIVMKRKSDAMAALSKWKKQVELKTGKQVKEAQSDNGGELIKELEYWRDTDGVQINSTTIASSHQNGPAERAIQTSENSMRATLADSHLPLDFWDEAVEHDAYIRNRLPVGPMVAGKLTCPEFAYSGEMPSIEKLRVWGSRCFAYVDPKTLAKGHRKDKLVPRGQLGVFMGYVEETEKQFKYYSPEKGRTVRTSTIDIDESRIGALAMNLKIRNSADGNGTPNIIQDSRPLGRPPKREEPQDMPSSMPILQDKEPAVELPLTEKEPTIPLFLDTEEAQDVDMEAEKEDLSQAVVIASQHQDKPAPTASAPTFLDGIPWLDEVRPCDEPHIFPLRYRQRARREEASGRAIYTVDTCKGAKPEM